MTPAELLDRLDRAATAADQRAAELRESAGRLRGEMARATTLLAEVAPPAPVEPPRRRGRPPRSAAAAARPNGAPAAPAPPAEHAPARRRGKRAIYPPEASDRQRYLIKMRLQGHDKMAADIEAGRRGLYECLYALGWKKPKKAANLPVAEAEVVPPEPGAGDRAPRPKLETAMEDSKVVEAAPPAPASEPAAKRKQSTTWSPADIATAAEQGIHPSSLPREPKGDLSPVDAAAEQAQAAAAAAARRREQMRASEPAVKWSNPDRQYRTLVASYDDRATAGEAP
jgi:hypothetical protein